MNNPRIVVSFPREHQEILIEGLKLVEARLESLAQSCASALPTRVRLEAIPQYLVFDIIAEVFDLVRGTTYALVADSTTILLQEYLAHFIGNFPSLSATEKQLRSTTISAQMKFKHWLLKYKIIITFLLAKCIVTVFRHTFSLGTRKLTHHLSYFLGLLPPARSFQMQMCEHGAT